MLTGFLEHRFLFLKDKMDITPGVAVSYYSDFGLEAFPGIDLGFQLNEMFRIYGNIGYTYRVPTYTDIYYESPTTIGNKDLQPESALSKELGIKFFKRKWTADLVVFQRSAHDLIDYVKENEEDRWKAENIQRVNTFGVESSLNYRFKIGKFSQRFNAGYTYLKDDLEESSFNYSKYSLNSMRHQLVAGFDSQFIKYLQQSVSCRYVQRPDGYSYQVFDLRLTANYRDIELSAFFNNLFDEEYTETSLVPMPGRNVMFQLSYIFN
jgi:iron complex outermembrane receptor protein